MDELLNGELARKLSLTKGHLNRLGHAVGQMKKWPNSANAKSYKDEMEAVGVQAVGDLIRSLETLMMDLQEEQ